MVMAISSKMNIPVPVSPHVALGSPSPPPPPPPPPPICNGGGVIGVPVLSDKMMMLFYGENGMAEKQK
ncbi:hypothetical protein ACSBR2_008488 [Camellia fascicularis]